MTIIVAYRHLNMTSLRTANGRVPIPKACLRVEGRNIVDAEGNTIILKGVGINRCARYAKTAPDTKTDHPIDCYGWAYEYGEFYHRLPRARAGNASRYAAGARARKVHILL